jgi:hypothetical protein
VDRPRVLVIKTYGGKKPTTIRYSNSKRTLTAIVQNGIVSRTGDFADGDFQNSAIVVTLSTCWITLIIQIDLVSGKGLQAATRTSRSVSVTGGDARHINAANDGHCELKSL